MYREQNYIFSFTFVYKSKTACLIKHLFKKKEKEKTSAHKPPSVRFLLGSEVASVGPMVWFRFTSVALFYLQ